MKSYSASFDRENCACARSEGIDASYKDLAEVCGRVRHKDAGWALVFLEKAAAMEIPVLYKRRNKRLGHRRELGGRKGRFPWKAAKAVLKALKSALANGRTKGLGHDYTIQHISANKKDVYPRLAAKGRRSRQYYETARIEIVLRSKEEIPKGVEITAPAKEKAEERQTAGKPETAAKQAEKGEVAIEKTEKRADTGKPETPQERPQPKKLEQEARSYHEHKHAKEKAEHHDHPRSAIEHGKGRKTEVKREG